MHVGAIYKRAGHWMQNESRLFDPLALYLHDGPLRASATGSRRRAGVFVSVRLAVRVRLVCDLKIRNV